MAVSRGMRAALVLVWFFVGGIAHFAFTAAKTGMCYPTKPLI